MLSYGSVWKTSVSLLEIHPLRDSELRDLCNQDTGALCNRFLQPLPGDDKIRVAFIPSFEQISWHLAREDYMAKALHDGDKSPVRGVISQSRRAWLIWHFDFVERKLKVQRIVLLDRSERERNVKELVALLRFAQWQARARGIERVVVWKPCDEIKQAADLLADRYSETKSILEDRDSSIPSLRRRWGLPTDAISWEHNEYYAWC